MFIIKKTSRYNDGSINVSYFKEYCLGVMCFSSRDYAKLFSSYKEAERICKSILCVNGSFVDVIEV